MTVVSLVVSPADNLWLCAEITRVLANDSSVSVSRSPPEVQEKTSGSGVKNRRLLYTDRFARVLRTVRSRTGAMMMNVLAGLAVWMIASLGLGLLIGLAMHGYSVNELPVRPPLADTGTTPSYPRAA